MLRLAFDFIITWRETRTRPNAYFSNACITLDAIKAFVFILIISSYSSNISLET